MAPRHAASSPITNRALIEKEISAAITALNDLDRDGLRARWKSMTRTEPPPHLPRWLLFRILAYRTQAAALGDLDRASIRLLDQIAEARETRRAAGEKLGKKPPLVPPIPPRPMKPGTILIREHEGQMHGVVVTAEGFSWSSKTYRSLTEVAFAITGTRWNGPRFFGLREKRKTIERAK